MQAAFLNKKMYVEMKALPWLLAAIRQEVLTQGVPEMEESESHKVCARIDWSFRDEVYEARVKLRSGKTVRRTGFVKRRTTKSGDLIHLSKDQACDVVSQELKPVSYTHLTLPTKRIV